jgi:GH15 family glucan-1,4-alpha-glucosidase
MGALIEDYGIIGDCETVALVGRNGSIDWLCLPRFDSDACFAALLGTRENGRWLLAPTSAVSKTTRRYRDHTLILETRFDTADGSVTLIVDGEARVPPHFNSTNVASTYSITPP